MEPEIQRELPTHLPSLIFANNEDQMRCGFLQKTAQMKFAEFKKVELSTETGWLPDWKYGEKLCDLRLHDLHWSQDGLMWIRGSGKCCDEEGTCSDKAPVFFFFKTFILPYLFIFFFLPSHRACEILVLRTRDGTCALCSRMMVS